jgi:hypothetical protein
MEYVCDAPGGRSWFRIETEEEAREESAVMRHSIERYFRAELEKARQSFHPPSSVFFEQEIGLKAHLQRDMPLFLTLRDEGGCTLVTAMLPQASDTPRAVRPLILGKGNTDPYMKYADAIFALGTHLRVMVDRARCYPYPPGRF